MTQFRSGVDVYNALMELAPKSKWVENTSYGHRGHGYMYHPKDISERLLNDVIGLVGWVVTTDGSCGLESSSEDYQVCFSMLKEKYKL